MQLHKHTQSLILVKPRDPKLLCSKSFHYVYLISRKHSMTYADYIIIYTMTPSNGHIFPCYLPVIRVSICYQWIPLKRPVTWSFDVFFDLRLNNPWGKQSRRRWFETQSRSLWRDCNGKFWKHWWYEKTNISIGRSDDLMSPVVQTYTHQKSLATLQPVEQRGTSIYWNGHNIANTACIHFKFGTVNNRYMPNSKPMKLGKTYSPNVLCYPLYNVDILIKNRFWSSNYTPYSIQNALGTRKIGIWMFVSINKY